MKTSLLLILGMILLPSVLLVVRKTLRIPKPISIALLVILAFGSAWLALLVILLAGFDMD